MTEPIQQISERVHQEAVTWYVRLTSGAVMPGDYAAFEHWRQQNTDHDRAYRDLEQLWQQLPGPLQADRQRRLNNAAARRPRHSQRLKPGLAVAASLVLVVFSGLYPDYVKHPLADYRTRIGKQVSITLADGSIAHLNTDTAIDVKISGNERRIELLSGEAEFDVVHDSNRPFRVAAGSTATEALGTRFIVRYNGESGMVTLLNGKIRTSRFSAQGVYADSVTLKAGEQIAFDSGNLGAVLQSSDRVSADAWRRGRLMMNFVPLKQVVAEINRYRRGRIQLLDDRLAEREVNIAIDIEHIDVWLEALQNSLPIKIDKAGPLVFLHS